LTGSINDYSKVLEVQHQYSTAAWLRS